MKTTPMELLKTRIAEKNARLSKMLKESGLCLRQAINISEAAPDFPADVTFENLQPWVSYTNEHDLAIKINSLYEEITMNEVTLDLDLMYCPKKYIVTTGGLTSPSGFNSSDRVFVQTAVAIHMNEYPDLRNLPKVNGKLYVSDLEKTEKAYL